MENIINVNVKNNKPYDVVIRNDFTELNSFIINLYPSKKTKLCIIADKNVSDIYGEGIIKILREFYDHVDCIPLVLGEVNKSLETVSKCYSFMIEKKYNRKDAVLALGGGICGDIAGFVAASYMRGIGFIQIPTTLLSMVDSSSGGKTGVNFDDYKNMIGAFKMPGLVYINTETLNTLSDREYSSGMAEVLKAGLIKDGNFYEWLISNFTFINDRDPEYVSEMISKSVNIKRLYVEKDPYEQNERAILNLGHTAGHALEKYTDFKYSHGECVALGCIVAAYISWKKEYLSMEEFYEIRDMFVPFSLPISLENIDVDKIISYMRSDKKNTQDNIRYILLKKIGKGIISEDVTENEISKALEAINYNPGD
ncbi:MAG: 3-dehydroquinate synthase [Lachnospiraceae bacterium]|nr:3-dehydroquinate synthase [Lachnospiraceae bacterium]